MTGYILAGQNDKRTRFNNSKGIQCLNMSKFWLHKITLQFTICNEDPNSKLQDDSLGSASLYLTCPFTFHLTHSKFKFKKRAKQV